jgi:DNA-binding XRE family transcriptional regulator
MQRVASDKDQAGRAHELRAKPRGWAAPSAETAAVIRAVVAENVRRERKAKAVTQQWLADACAVAENTISRLEKPEDEPRLLTLVAVSFALEVPVLKILRGVPGLTYGT